MTPSQETKLDIFIAKMVTMADAKYRKGAKEHNNDLSSLTILELNSELLGEAIDSIFYLLEQREKIIKFKELYGLPTSQIRSVHDIPADPNLY